jgi:phosphoenolpyruvate synthase/pyruvate phosphate dikinase
MDERIGGKAANLGRLIAGGFRVPPGVVTGRIRVVQDIEALPTVQGGEIMVTSNTDPGRMAVFSKLGVLITEPGASFRTGRWSRVSTASRRSPR